MSIEKQKRIDKLLIDFDRYEEKRSILNKEIKELEKEKDTIILILQDIVHSLKELS